MAALCKNSLITGLTVAVGPTGVTLGPPAAAVVASRVGTLAEIGRAVLVGILVAVGTRVGVTVGTGVEVGRAVGLAVGIDVEVGRAVGVTVGIGVEVGKAVGLAVGRVEVTSLPQAARAKLRLREEKSKNARNTEPGLILVWFDHL